MGYAVVRRRRGRGVPRRLPPDSPDARGQRVRDQPGGLAGGLDGLSRARRGGVGPGGGLLRARRLRRDRGRRRADRAEAGPLRLRRARARSARCGPAPTASRCSASALRRARPTSRATHEARLVPPRRPDSSARRRCTGSTGSPRSSAAPRSGPSATTSPAGSRSAATRRASSSTSPPTRSRRAATRSSRSAACSRTTRARWPPSRRSSGSACVLVQESWVDWPDAVYDRVGNIQLSRILGADVRLVEAGFGIGFKESWEAALADVEARGGKPYAIPAGASDHPLGGLGYARWAGEVAEQERELGVFFDTVIVCSVTGSTQAGMVAGFAAQERERARARHRRLGEAGRDAGPGLAHRPRDRRADRASAASCATTSSCSTTATTRASTASPTRRRWPRSAWPAAWRG